MHIILIGYMGSGKSLIGALLAKKLNLPFMDLDHFISQEEGMSIPKLFHVKGEVYFRKKEQFYLEELLNRKEKTVIALGGGTPCYGNTMEVILKYTSYVFYVKARIETLVERLSKEQHSRPLLSNLKTTDLSDFIRKHLFERSFFYTKAPYTIDTDQKSADEIITEIIKKLREMV